MTNYKKDDRISYFVADQIEAIKQVASDIQIEVFGKTGSGIIGYLRNLGDLRKTIEEYQPDLIHAHYGFCGALACLQRKVPVVTTYHGSDINSYKNRLVSYWAVWKSKCNIFVTESLAKKVHRANRNNSYMIPCGVSTRMFRSMDKRYSRVQVGLDTEWQYVLFPASKLSMVKNYELARKVVDMYNERHERKIKLIELDGYSRGKVPYVINAVDILLMTSHTEGSPQVIKEAIACGCPIVSVPVGDVETITEEVPNAFVSKNYEIEELTGLLQQALSSAPYKEGAVVLQKMGYENETIAKKIVEIYKKCINDK